MQCNKPIWLEKNKLRVPCGKCRGCRIKRSSEWTMRLTHELHLMKYKGIFLTLTYNEESLPYTETGRPTLDKSALQKFIKKVRRRIAHTKGKIKYYACGEYGEETKRPHYHLIILGMTMRSEYDKSVIIDSWNGCDWTPIRTKKSFGSVSPDSIRYTTDYIQKKFISSDPEKIRSVYGDATPPFQLCSQGIGKDWALEEKERIQRTGKISYKGKEVALPRYYLTKVKVDEEVKIKNKTQAIMASRKKYNLDPLDLNTEVLGRVMLEKYEEELHQTERNIKARKALAQKKPL